MRLILHAGTHKTGTSTIQRVLYDHRDELRSQGVLYPDSAAWFGGSYRGHHPLAHAVAFRKPEALATAREFLHGLAEQARPDETVLLSAEPVYRHVLHSEEGDWWHRHDAYLKELVRELTSAGFDPEAVLVFRRRDQFVESVYHERVSRGFGRPFEYFLDHADRLLDYERQLRLFHAAFPRVSSLRYEDLAGRELVSSFLRVLGIRPPVMNVDHWERRSTDSRLSLWMAARYREDPDDELVVQRRRFAKNPVSDELFDDFGQVTLWADPDERRQLLDSYGDHAPIDDARSAAVLTPGIEARIDAAFDEYLVAKGLSSTGRSARRPS